LPQLPQNVVNNGDRLAITIPKEEYLVGVEACKYNFHGRIIWSKGSTSYVIEKLFII